MKEELDSKRIENNLDQLEEYLGDLEEDLPEEEEEYVKNRVVKRACEKDFELASQSLIDICNLIISQKGLGYPEDNRESIEKLVEEEVIEKDLGNSLKDMVSFRNLLVHRYGKIDDRKAFYHFKEGTSDFYRFVESMNSFLTNI